MRKWKKAVILTKALHSFHFSIGGLPVTVEVEEGLLYWRTVKDRFAPFATGADDAPVLRLHLSNDEIATPDSKPIISLGHDISTALMTLDVYPLEQGYRLAAFRGRTNGDACWLRFKYGCPEMELAARKGKSLAEATSASALAYALAAAQHNTLLAHGCCVELSDRAFLFIGPSGAGKSTHGRMWLERFPHARLLNDDHPAITTSPIPMAHGTPWSGKTHCYRQAKAPLAGIVRIIQAQTNEIERLDPLHAYASLLSSFSTTAWITENSDNLHQSLSALASTVPVFNLKCLPNTSAAEIVLQAFSL